MLINVLADTKLSKPLGAIVLISAPFIGPQGWPSDEIAPRSDFAERLPRVCRFCCTTVMAIPKCPYRISISMPWQSLTPACSGSQAAIIR